MTDETKAKALHDYRFATLTWQQVVDRHGLTDDEMRAVVSGWAKDTERAHGPDELIAPECRELLQALREAQADLERIEAKDSAGANS